MSQIELCNRKICVGLAPDLVRLPQLSVLVFKSPHFLSHLAANTGPLVIRSPTLDRPKAEFSGFAQGDGLVTPPDFVSMIGTLLPIAPCGRSSL